MYKLFEKNSFKTTGWYPLNPDGSEDHLVKVKAGPPKLQVQVIEIFSVLMIDKMKSRRVHWHSLEFRQISREFRGKSQKSGNILRNSLLSRFCCMQMLMHAHAQMSMYGIMGIA